MRKKNTELPTASPRATLCRASLFVLFGAAALPATAATIDNYWRTVDGSSDGAWTNAGHWTGGLPADLSPTDASRARFRVAESGAVSNVTLGAGETGIANMLYLDPGKTVNLSLASGSSLLLPGSGSLTVSSSSSAASHLNVEGPESGTAVFDFGAVQLAGAQSSGGTMSLSGGLTANAGSITVGRGGDGHTMTVENGVSLSSSSYLIVSGTVNENSGIGNDHKFIIRGAGTNATFAGSSGTSVLGIVVGARPLYIGNNTSGTGSSQVQSGNELLVQDGAYLALDATGKTTTQVVQVGQANYRRDNLLEVSGAGSLFEVKGNAQTTIGHTSTSTYDNKLIVKDGGTFRTETETIINSGAGAAMNRRNFLNIEAGGTVITSDVINNNDSIVILEEGGSLLAENLDGSAATAILNINGAGNFQASGYIGEGVTVNVGNGGAATFGFHSTGQTLELDGEMNLNNGSTSTFNISSTGDIDSIVIGSGASVVIDENAALIIASTTYAFSAGDVFQLFSGNLAGISGAFGESFITIPSLGGDLLWDTSRFTAEYGYELTVVPEPSQVALTMGVLAILALGVTRRARAGRTAAR